MHECVCGVGDTYTFYIIVLQKCIELNGTGTSRMYRTYTGVLYIAVGVHGVHYIFCAHVFIVPPPNIYSGALHRPLELLCLCTKMKPHVAVGRYKGRPLAVLAVQHLKLI